MFLRRNRRRCHVTSVVRQKQKKQKKEGMRHASGKTLPVELNVKR